MSDDIFYYDRYCIIFIIIGPLFIIYGKAQQINFWPHRLDVVVVAFVRALVIGASPFPFLTLGCLICFPKYGIDPNIFLTSSEYFFVK